MTHLQATELYPNSACVALNHPMLTGVRVPPGILPQYNLFALLLTTGNFDKLTFILEMCSKPLALTGMGTTERTLKTLDK